MAKKYKVDSLPVSDKEARDKSKLDKAKGYNPLFLKKTISINCNFLSSARAKLLPEVNSGSKSKLDYTNLSVYYNTKRRLPFYSAYNINLDLKSKAKRAAKFKPDPRFDEELQLNYDYFYNLVPGNKEDFDIGHMAASNEMGWGTDGQLKSLQTFFFPNTCPQAADLNEKLWNTMEQKLVTAHGEEAGGKICVFTGPILNSDDPFYVNEESFQMPMRFFKVVVFEVNKKLYCTAMVMSHVNLVTELGLIIEKDALALIAPTLPTPFDDFPYKGIYQVNLSLIKKLTGFDFKWQGVERLDVKTGYHVLDIIDANETPDQAEDTVNGFVAIRRSPIDRKNPINFVLAR